MEMQVDSVFEKWKNTLSKFAYRGVQSVLPEELGKSVVQTLVPHLWREYQVDGSAEHWLGLSVSFFLWSCCSCSHEQSVLPAELGKSVDIYGELQQWEEARPCANGEEESPCTHEENDGGAQPKVSWEGNDF
jgi:hypothetical protein